MRGESGEPFANSIGERLLKSVVQMHARNSRLLATP
jgi:hypothetical protein